MKLFLSLIILSLYSFNLQARTCECVQSKQKVQDMEAYSSCLAQILSGPLDTSGESESDRAREAYERARQSMMRQCESDLWFEPVELFLMTKDQTVKLDEFKSIALCNSEISANFSEQCR